MNIVKVTEKKSCVDCLHCKVSKDSTKNNRVCFCAKRKQKKYEPEFFWKNKSVCKNFEDMSD
jgi:hypothetical protein